MAGGNNRNFLRDPMGFFRDHFLIVFPNGQRERALIEGIMEIDLAPGPMPGAIVLENYAYQRHRHKPSAQPVLAFYLRAEKNTPKRMIIDGRCDYMFTDNLSGCLFAASYNQNGTVTVEHFNAYDEGSIEERVEAILNDPDHDFTMHKVLSPCEIEGANKEYVKEYTGESCVIGIRTTGRWRFYYKPSRDGATREL